MRVGIIGVGNMGGYLLRAIRLGLAGPIQIVGLSDLPLKEREQAALAAEAGCAWTTNAEDLAAHGAQVVVESASQAAVRRYAVPLLERGVSLVFMSTGALADSAFYEEVAAAAEKTGQRVYLPSGAIGGLDALWAASVDGLEEVTLVTSKHPSALASAPFFQESAINPAKLAERLVLFEGPAREATRLFPANVNVAAAVSLAGLGPDRTSVVVVADPSLQRNVHEVVARGRFGEMRLRFENVPSPDNPRTSYLACLSVLATLKRLSQPVNVG